MNEELKIIITAVTSEAKKGIQGVKQELSGVTKEAQGASKGFGTAMKGFGKGAAIAIAAIAAVGAALIALGKKSLEFQRTQAKLNAAFQSMGASAQQAAESYRGLFRFLGDSDKSVEAAAHLAKLTVNQQELSEWTKICQGIYATFGDSLPIEGLTEAANETARVGQVTGTLADALNWAGVSEDEFNAKLATTNSFAEREALIRSTLNGLYKDAAEIYEKNNKALIEYNESQARLDESMTAAGAAVTPLLTALNNLSAVLFDALKPALDLIIPAIATFINWITKGIEAVLGFFGVVTGKSTTVNTFSEMGKGISNVSTGVGTVADSLDDVGDGADNIASGLAGATKEAEKLKRVTMGFDELNIVPSTDSASSGSSSNKGKGSSSGNKGSSSGETGPAYMTPIVDASKFTMEVEETDSEASGFATLMKNIANELKDVFAPTIKAWTAGFETIKQAWNNSKKDFIAGAKGIRNAFVNLGSYIVKTFIPDVVNGFSVNLAPMITDIFSFELEQSGKAFKLFGETLDDATTNIIIPALELVKDVSIDMFESMGNAWDKYGEPFLTELGKMREHLRGVFKTLYEEYIKPTLENILNVLRQVWDESLKPLFDNLMESVMEIGLCFLKLYNEFIAPVVDWILKNILPIIQNIVDDLIKQAGKLLQDIGTVINGIVDVIKGIIQFITGVFTGDWELAWDGILNILEGVWDAIEGVFSAVWDNITYIFDWQKIKEFFVGVWGAVKSAFTGVKDWFKNTFTGAKEGAKEGFSRVKEFFAEKWTEIKDAFSGVKTWFKSNFGTAWSDIKTAWSGVKGFFSEKWTDIKSAFGNIPEWFRSQFHSAWTKVKEVFSSGGKVFDGIKDGILNGLKAVINALIGGINKVIAVPFKGLNDALRGIRDIDILGARPFTWLPTISVPKIPLLAKGGIVDRATLAMIGEQGKEAVVPLENNTAWMDKLVEKLAARTSGPSKIVLMLDGKELGWANINSINNITRQTGALQLVMA